MQKPQTPNKAIINTHYTVGEDDRESTLNTASLTYTSDRSSQVIPKAQSRTRSPRTGRVSPGRGGGSIREHIAVKSAWNTIRLSWFEPKVSLKSSMALPDVIDKENVQDNIVKDQLIISTVHTLFKIFTKKDDTCKLMTEQHDVEITPKFFTQQWTVNKVKENLVYFIDKNKQIHVLLKVQVNKDPDFFALKGKYLQAQR